MTPTVEAGPDIRLVGPRRAEPASRHGASATLDIVSDRPPSDSDATDDPDAFCDLPELEVRSVSPQRTATRLLRETSRVEAFSDGVVAIAITLLVLTLAVPT